ncbi:MAG: Hpt domain-containing protein [Rhodoferax sp.]|nr:Hpt domain-containing protein [Rhodoferax sp.]
MTPSDPRESPFTYLNPEQALNNVGDAGALREMLVMLQDVLAKDVALISSLMEQHDFVEAQHLLHSLKGCMPIFCNATLCEELTQVEHMSKSTDRATSAPAYAVLRPKLEQLQAELAMHLG